MPDHNRTYLIPREAPWIVQIGDFRFASCSEVCRLLIKLDDENTYLKKQLKKKQPKKKQQQMQQQKKQQQKKKRQLKKQ